MTTKPTLFLAGHHGMVGSAIARSLQAGGLDRAQVELLTASRALAETIARVTGYPGALRFDPSKPDGPARKLLDVSRLRGCLETKALIFMASYPWWSARNGSIARSLEVLQ